MITSGGVAVAKYYASLEGKPVTTDKTNTASTVQGEPGATRLAQCNYELKVVGWIAPMKCASYTL